MKKLKWASALLVPALLLGACSDKEEKEDHASHGTEEVKVYTVATDVSFPPFEYEVDGKYICIDVDIINAIADDQGFKIKLQPMDFKGIVPSLQAKQVDVGIAGMSITEDRKEVVDFTDAYFDASISLATKADNEEITKLEDLKGKKVATKKGTVSSEFAEKVKSEYGFETVMFDDSASMYLDVKNGNTQALLEDTPVIKYAVKQNDELNLKVIDNAVPADAIASDQYGIAVLKGANPELLEKLNAGLKAIKENGKYQEILDKYLEVATETEETTETETENEVEKEEGKTE